MNRPHQPGRILPRVWILFLAAFAVLAAAGRHPGAIAQAQWTTSGNNVSNTNPGNVGVGTAAPTSVLHAKGNLSSQLTGTVGVTQNSATVTGTGTAFTTELAVGDSIKIGISTFTVSAIASATSLTLDANYAGTTASGFSAFRDPGLFAIDNGAGVSKLAMDKMGRVGIGTASPSAKLTVVETATTPNRGLALSQYSSDTTPSVLQMTKLRGTPSAPATVVNGYTLASINANAYIGTYVAPGGISFVSNGTISPGSVPMDILFRAGSTGTGVERMRITSGGNVGVGTATPGFKFDVQGGQVNASGGLCIAGDCKTSWSQVGNSSQWATSGTNAYYTSGSVGIGTTTPGARLDVGAGAAARGAYTDLLIGAGGNNPQLEFYGATKSSAIAHDEALGGLVFYTNGAAFSPSFFLSNAGNVGVGTTAPTSKLEVNGFTKVEGAGAGLSVKNTNGWSQMYVARTGANQAAFIASPSVAQSPTNPYWAMGLSSDGSAGWSLDSFDGTNMI